MVKRLKYQTIIFILIILFMDSTAGGQIFPEDSLMYYLELAAKNNPTVLQRFAEYQAALQKVPQVGTLPDPDLTIGVFVKPMELVMGNQTADIKLMQMFPWFGTLKYARDEMSLMAKAKFESFRDAKLQVYYDVESTWYDLYKLSQNLRITGRNLQILRTIERLAIVRYKTSAVIKGSSSSSSSSSMNRATLVESQSTTGSSQGMQGMSVGQADASTSGQGSGTSMQGSPMGNAPGNSGLPDLYRILIDISNLENDIALIKDRQNTIAARFNTFINRPLRTRVTIADTLRADTLKMALNIVPDTILKNNPMLAMLKYEQESLEARKKMVSRMGYPMVGVGVDYSLINKSEMVTSPDNGKDMIMPMVSVTLPVYRKKYRAMQNEAELLKTSSIQNFSATANNLLAEYYQAVQLYNDATRRIKLYTDQYLLASKSLDIMLKSFSTAGTSLTDILLIRQQTLDYELKHAEAVADQNIAIAWLNRLTASPRFQ